MACAICAAASSSRADAGLRSRSSITTEPLALQACRARRNGPGVTSIDDHQRHSTRKCPPIGRVSAPATTRSRSDAPVRALSDAPRTISNEHCHPVPFCRCEQLLPGPLRGNPQVQLDMLGRQRLGGARRA